MVFGCCGAFFFECFTSDFSLCLIAASIGHVLCMPVSNEGEYGGFNGGSCLVPCLTSGASLIFECCGPFFFECFASDFSLCLIGASIRNVVCMAVSDEGEYRGFNGESCLGPCLTGRKACCVIFTGTSVWKGVCLSPIDEGEHDGGSLLETGTLFRFEIFRFEICSCELFILSVVAGEQLPNECFMWNTCSFRRHRKLKGNL